MKKNKLILFSTILILFISVSVIHFFYFYNPITEPKTYVTYSKFEDIFLADDISEINFITNKIQIEFKLKYGVNEKYNFNEGDKLFAAEGSNLEMLSKRFEDILQRKSNINNTEINYMEKEEARIPFNAKTFIGDTFLIFLFLCLNFIPSLISSNKLFFNQVFALNFFLGWTIIGWIICLVWSLKKSN